MDMATPRGHPSQHTATTTTTETIRDKQLMETIRTFLISTIDLICCNTIYLFIKLFMSLQGNKRLKETNELFCALICRLTAWHMIRSVLDHLLLPRFTEGGIRKHWSPSFDNCWYQMRCDHEVSKEWIMKREKHLEHKHSMGTLITLLTLFLHSQRSHLIKESRTQKYTFQ